MKLSGNIFTNTKKQNDSQPSMRGDVKDENGVEYEVAAWTKLDKNGNKYLSLLIKPKEPREDAPVQKAEESELPF